MRGRPLATAAFLLCLVPASLQAQDLPTITLTPLTGAQGGDITIDYLISDASSDPVGLLVEYATSAGGPWLAATVTGDTSGIAAADYNSSLVWNSRSDLDGQELSHVWLRITSHDAGGWGTADTIDFPLDNKPPENISARSAGGDNSVLFYFDESVADSTATDPSHLNLSGGLTVDLIQPRSNRVTAADVPTARSGLRAAAIDGKIYVVGGEPTYTTLEIYDPVTDTWSTGASETYGNHGAVVDAYNGKLYLNGGGSTFRVYDPRENTWTDLSSGHGYYYAAGGFINGKFYFVMDDQTYEYDVAKGTRTNKAPLPTARNEAAYGIIAGKLYVAGGSLVGSGDLTSVLEVYDPATNSWTSKTSMPIPLRYGAGGVIDDEFYVAGGYTDAGDTDTVYIYSPISDIWWVADGLSAPRYHAAACAYRGRLHVFGGHQDGVGELTRHEVIHRFNGYLATLSSGQHVLAGSDLTVTATDIGDGLGNTISEPLQYSFGPLTGSAPGLTAEPVTGIQSGDIPFDHTITDTDGNPVSLRCEYSVDGGGTWVSATTAGSLDDLFSGDYQGTITWQSGTDLPGQQHNEVLFRITPWDRPGIDGTAQTLTLEVDNLPPSSVSATGWSGYNTVSFWFDEPVVDSTATNTAHISLSGGLTVDHIDVDSTFTLLNSSSIGRTDAAAAVLNGRLYVIGGQQNDRALESYDPVTGTWTTLASSNHSHQYSPLAASIGGKLYVVGGNSEMEIYDPVTNSWSDGAGAPNGAPNWVTGGVIDGKLYMAAGEWGGTEVKIYNPTSGNWTTGTSIPTNRWGASAGVIDGILYVVGGDGGGGALPTLEAYEPDTDTWISRASLPYPVMNCAAGVIDGRLYVAAPDTVYVYDPGSDSWAVDAVMPRWGGGTTGGVIRDRFYVVGGDTGSPNRLESYNPKAGYRLTLGGGQVLPAAESPVTVTATDIADIHGNKLAVPIETAFDPATGDLPTLDLTPMIGTYGQDVEASYRLSDIDGSPLSLQVEYSTDGGSTWQSATTQGGTAGIYPNEYPGSFTWSSGTDLPGQSLDEVLLRVTPRDNETVSGDPELASFSLDNSPPSSILATGLSGYDQVGFWFDEPVADADATDTANITLSGLTVGSIGVQNWSSGKPLPDPGRSGSASAVLNGKLYVIGGGSAGQEVQIYDPASDTWTLGTQSNGWRDGGWATVLNGRIYVCGGDGFEYYDPGTDTWSWPAGHSWAGQSWAVMEAINNRIYIAGGSNQSRRVYRYNPETDQWSGDDVVASMPTARRGAVSGVIAGKMFVAGGEINDTTYYATLEVYDPVTNTWTTRAPMPKAIAYGTAGVAWGRLVVVGGFDGTEFNSDVYVYEPSSDIWTTAATIPHQRWKTTAGVIDNWLYIASGYCGGYIQALDIYDWRGEYEITLGSGEVLPASDVAVTITASNISDRRGNTLTDPLQTVFYPTTGQPPSIEFDWPVGVQMGDVTLDYEITDAEGNPVTLTTEYSTDHGGSWQTATVTGTTDGIYPAAYSGSLVWNSATDLAGQEVRLLRLRITPSDNATTPGDPAAVIFDLDNRAPVWITAEGTSGDSTLQFHFDEPVTEASATNPANFSLSSPFGIAAIAVNDLWDRSATVAPTPAGDAAVVGLGGKLYVLGGWDNSNHLDRLEIYDPATDSWSTGASLLSPRSSAVAAALNGKIYLLSGDNDAGRVNTFEVYDPLTNTWTALGTPPLNPAYWDAQARGIGGRLYVNQRGDLPTMFVYDPETDGWTSQSGGVDRECPATAVIDGKLYLAGGYDHNTGTYTNTLKVFDPVTGVTEDRASMPTPRSRAVGGVIGGKLYVVGGENNSGSLAKVEIYDPATNGWSPGPGMPLQRNDFMGAVVEAQFYHGRFIEWQGSYYLVFDRLDRGRYRLILSSGQVLPPPPNTLTLTASNIIDWAGNTVAGTLEDTFTPSSGQPPTIRIYGPSEVGGGDLTIQRFITDAEESPVWLKAEYQLAGEGTWNLATVQGDTAAITAANYAGTLTWQSGTDLPGQVVERIRFRITPRDNETTWGTSDTTMVSVDNLAPAAVTPTGVSGGSTITLTFDEPVREATATDTGHYTLSNSLTVSSVDTLVAWYYNATTAPTQRINPGVGVMNDRLYVVGGQDGTDYRTTAEVYDPQSDTWTALPDLTVPREAPHVFAINGLLYVISGHDQSGWINSLEVYDPDTNSWTLRPTEGQGSWWNRNGGVINGKLYLNTGDEPARIAVYDPHTDAWTYVDGGLSHGDVAAGVIDDQLYLAGGWNYSGNYYASDLVVFDPADGTTDWLDWMPTSRSSATGAVIEGKFYVIDGGNDWGICQLIEVYDPATNQWSTGLSGTNHNTWGVGAVIAGRILRTFYADGYTSFDIFERNSYRLNLDAGQTLPSPPDSVTVTVTGLTDWLGNTLTGSIETTFTPSTGQIPAIVLYPPSGILGGNLGIGYRITDAEGNPVALTADYMLSGETTWQPATLQGTTEGITSDQYHGSVVWNSDADLPDQTVYRVRLRITPWDQATVPGTADTIVVTLDNLAPAWVAAEGASGDTAFTFWFDEPVTEGTAAAPGNLNFNGRFTAQSVEVVQEWTADAITAPNPSLNNRGVGEMDGRLYLAGGWDGSNSRTEVDVYDPDAGAWSSLPDMPTPRHDPLVFSIGGILYVYGGQDPGSWVSIIESYDPEQGTWTSRWAPAYGGEWDASGRVINGRFYLNTGQDPPRIAIYDPTDDSWTEVDGGLPHGGVSTGVIDGKLYIAGGWNHNGGYIANDLVVFDPVTGSTDWLTGIPVERQSAVSGVIDGKLYLAGGLRDSGTSFQLWIYDPGTDSWSLGAYVPRQGSWMAGAVVGGRIYYGYWDDESMKFDMYDRHHFRAYLGAGEYLPAPPDSVQIGAFNTADLAGNSLGTTGTTLWTYLHPSTGDPPSVYAFAPAGFLSGDVTVPYRIHDPEGSLVSLRAEYRLPESTAWLPATLSGTVTGISTSSYVGSLTWHSGVDLPAQALKRVGFRLIPRDNETTEGTPGSAVIDLDNRAPGGLQVAGATGDSVLTFRFDEPVREASVTAAGNVTLAGGFSIESIAVNEQWSVDQFRLPDGRSEIGLGALDGKLYAVGGLLQPDHYNRVDVYDPDTRSWSQVAGMPTPRRQTVVVGLNGLLYVIGGLNHEEWFDLVEVYDPETNNWSTRTSAPTQLPGWKAQGAVIDGRIYVHCDGYIHIYDPDLDSWESLVAGIPDFNDGSVIGVIDGLLYVAGGHNYDGDWFRSDLVIFDPDTRTHTFKSSLPRALAYGVGAVLDGRFFVLGGWDADGAVRIVQCYDPATDQWTESPLPVPNDLNVLGAVIDGRVYAPPQWWGDQMTFDVYDRDTFTLELGSGETLPFQRITLQTDGIQDWYGNLAGTLATEFVPEDSNANPTIELTAITDEVFGNVTITAALADAENDDVTIRPRWSVDGGVTWRVATTPTDTTGIGPADPWTLLWQSQIDLPGLDTTDLRFRITVTDNEVEIGNSDEITFHLDNNTIPTVQIDYAYYNPADTTWVYSWILADNETDTLTIEGEFSLDDGFTWQSATTIGVTSGIIAGPMGPPAATDSLRWQVQQDLPDATWDVLFRITAFDNDASVPAVWPTRLNMLGLPEAAITSDLSGEWSGDIVIDYQADDPDGDPIDLVFLYEYPADSWREATVTGSTSLSGPSEYAGSVTWHSGSDLAGLDVEAVGFRIWPHTTGGTGGFAAETDVHVDNNELPTVTLETPSGPVGRDVHIPCTLTDAEGDTLDFYLEYSLDGGTTWNMASYGPQHRGLLPAGYSVVIEWHSLDDVGYIRCSQVKLRVWANDHDVGPDTFTGTFSLANYVGDYTGDITVDFADFATLVSAWNSQDTYHDIGPATGTVPDLVPVYDGKIDFEDLAVYAMMWTWSDANPPAVAARAIARPVTTRAAGRKTAEKDDHPVRLEQPMPDDPWAPDDGILELRFQTSGVSGLTSAGLTLEYDTRYLKLSEVVPGPMLGTTGGAKPSLVQLKRVNEEEGRIELLLGRIDPERPSVSGSGMLAVARFEKLSREDSVVRVTYDLRDRQAAAIAGGDYEASVQATLRPTEFALLQNYPNPFNGETVIRFQLPTEQRVQIQLYNMRGQLVTTLLDERRDAGYHRVSWNGRDAAGRPVASGIYIYLIQAGTNRTSKKLVILR
jgi:N-acetylneuraminic acid mutarotase